MTEAYAAYLATTYGPDALYEAIEETPLEWEYCATCVTDTPLSDERNCLICGR